MVPGAVSGHHDAGQESAEKRMDADDFRAQRRKEDGPQDQSEDCFSWFRLVQKRLAKQAAQHRLDDEDHACHIDCHQRKA